MFQLHFATTNKAKIASLKRDVSELEVEVVSVEMDIPEVRADETDEIARQKVLYAFQKIKKPCVAQDGGFYINSLNGFPRAYVNFVVGTIGIDGILKLVESKERECEFRDTFAYIDDKLGEPMLFHAISRGTLAKEPRGELKPYNWGEVHKIFIPEGSSKTFTEMSAEEMDSWRAGHYENWCGRKFAKWLEKNRL